MTFKEITILVLTVLLGLLLIPVVSPAVLVAVMLWKIALNKSKKTVMDGFRVYETSGAADKMLHLSMKISSFGFQALDFSVSPALAVPRYGYIVTRTELMAKYSELAKRFICVHEAGHLLDPQMRKIGTGLGIEGEYRADAYAVKKLSLTATQLRDIYDELITNVTSGMKPSEAKVIEDVMIKRLVQAIKVSEEIWPTKAILTATVQ